MFVGDVFNEEEDENVVLRLGSIHAAAELVGAVPGGGVAFGFFEGHAGGAVGGRGGGAGLVTAVL